MIGNQIALGVYAAFLLIILIINLLYVFQVFKFRLTGDASFLALSIHIGLIVTILVFSSIFLNRG